MYTMYNQINFRRHIKQVDLMNSRELAKYISHIENYEYEANYVKHE